MKNLRFIITGILIGIVVSGALILHHMDKIAYSVGNTWSTWDIVDYKTVFSPSSKGKELYNLIYTKTAVLPGKNALTEIAKSYGLTIEEAEAAVNGSVSVIFNSPARRSTTLSQTDALLIVQEIQNDYADIKELFDLEQQLSVSVGISEIFANGDLSDSGFDLISDLDRIENILFIEETDSEMGANFAGQLDSPYLPSIPENEQENYIARETGQQTGDGNGNAVATEAGETGGGGNAAGSGNGNDNGESGGSGGNGGFQQPEPEKLPEDVCLPFEDQDVPADSGDYSFGGSGGQTGGTGGTGGSGGDDGTGASGGDNDGAGTDEPNYQTTDANGNVMPAWASDWSKTWCPGLNETQAQTSYGDALAVAGISSVGDPFESIINESLTAGAAATYEGPGISANASVCLTFDLVYKTVSSYQPGQSCILCEVEAINELMDETLSHSLVPNKVTGNLLESAKCKKSFEPLLDMKFIAIAAPVSTPLNDDVVFGKNIVEEWNKFVDRYQPLLMPSVKDYSALELVTIDPYATQQEVLNDVNKEISAQTKEALSAVSAYNTASTAMNTISYLQNVLNEIRQMKELFAEIKVLYEKLNENACNAIKKKEDIS